MSPKLPAPLAAHLADRVHAARRCYRKRLDRCRRKISASAVHDLRVEMRRILALLDLLAPLHFAGPVRKLRKTFKKRLDAFAELRDTQVQERLLRPLWPSYPQAREFRKFLGRRERKSAAEVGRCVRRARCARLNRRLKEIEKRLCRCAEASTRDTPVQAAIAASSRAFARVATLRGLVRRNDPATIHRLRVAFKRFRYLSELLQPFLPRATVANLKRMRNYQAVAGDVQDLVVLLARLDQAVNDGKCEPEKVKSLRAELLRRRNRAIDLFVRRIDDWQRFKPDGSRTSAAPAQRRKN